MQPAYRVESIPLQQTQPGVVVTSLPPQRPRPPRQRSRFRGQTQANLISGFCIGIACLWFLILFCPLDWLFHDNAIINLRITLFRCASHKGGISGFVSLGLSLAGQGKLKKALKHLTERNMWLRDAMHQFCATGIEEVFRWCGEWEAAYAGSLIMIFFGTSSMAALALAGYLVYYYSHENPTKTGRMWLQASLVAAPALGIFGTMIYGACTSEFGKIKHLGSIGLKAYNVYGAGFIFAVLLAFLSLVPVVLHMFIFKISYEEKQERYSGEVEMYMTQPPVEPPPPQLRAPPPPGPAKTVVQEPTYSYGATYQYTEPAVYVEPVPPQGLVSQQVYATGYPNAIVEQQVVYSGGVVSPGGFVSVSAGVPGSASRW